MRSGWTTSALDAREKGRNARPSRREPREPTCHSPIWTSCPPASRHDRNLHLLLRILPSLSPADAKLFKMRILERRSDARHAKLLSRSRALLLQRRATTRWEKHEYGVRVRYAPNWLDRAMGRKGWLGNAAMMNVICQSAVASPLLRYKRDTVVDGSYALDIIGEVSRQDHCPMPLAAQVRQQYEAAFVNGCGDLDFFVLAREAARVAGL
jgi:hypothetical protein